MRWKQWPLARADRNVVSMKAPEHDIEIIPGESIVQEMPCAGLALRHLLRMIAYNPAAAGTTTEVIARLRPFVDGGRLALHKRYESGGSSAEYERDLALLDDGALAGLCHVARFCADDDADSIIAPFAALVLGRPEPRDPNTASELDLLFVLPESAAAQRRADRMIAFVLSGLAALGFMTRHAVCTLTGAALLAEAMPSLAGKLRDVRFVWGCYGLYASLPDTLPISANARRSCQTMRPRSASNGMAFV